MLQRGLHGVGRVEAVTLEDQVPFEDWILKLMAEV
jgi:hypothetical protein